METPWFVGYCTRNFGAAPLSQGKPIEWKHEVLVINGLQETASDSPLAGETN